MAALLKNPEVLVTLKKSLEHVDSIAKSAVESARNSVAEEEEETAQIQAMDRDSIANDFTYGWDDQSSAEDVGKTEGTLDFTPHQTGSDMANVSTTIDPDTNTNLYYTSTEPKEAGEISDEESQTPSETIDNRKAEKRKKVDVEDRKEHDRNEISSNTLQSKRKRTRGSSYRPEYQIPSKHTPRIDEPQEVERSPINDRSIICPYLSITRWDVPVSEELLNEMKRRFKDYRATHVLADETGYYILFDTYKFGNRHMSECHSTFKTRNLRLLGYKLNRLHKHLAKGAGYDGEGRR